MQEFSLFIVSLKLTLIYVEILQDTVNRLCSRFNFAIPLVCKPSFVRGILILQFPQHALIQSIIFTMVTYFLR